MEGLLNQYRVMNIIFGRFQMWGRNMETFMDVIKANNLQLWSECFTFGLSDEWPICTLLVLQ